MCKKRIVVVAPEKKGRSKNNWQVAARKLVQKKHGGETKVIFSHYEKFDPQKSFPHHVIKGASLILVTFGGANPPSSIEGIPVRMVALG